MILIINFQKGYSVTVEDVDENCCRPVKTLCKNTKKKKLKCFTERGRACCDSGKGKCTCSSLKRFVAKQSIKFRRDEHKD